MISRTRAVVRGLAALVAILAILVGIPAALYAFGGNPIPQSLPSLSQITQTLTQPDDGTAFIAVLTWVGWIAWASMALSLIVQAASELRGARVPRLPMMGWQQQRAAALTGAVVAMLTVVPTVAGAGSASAAPAPSTTTASTASAVGTATDNQDTAARSASTTSTSQAKTSTSSAATSKAAPVVVRPGDTLWEIADDELGDPTRYPEIATRNQIADPDVIDVGQRLSMPGASSPDSRHAPTERPHRSTGTQAHPGDTSAPSQTAPDTSPAAGETSSPSTPSAASSAPASRPAASSPSGGSGSSTTAPPSGAEQDRAAPSASSTAPATASTPATSPTSPAQDSPSTTEADSPAASVLAAAGLGMLAAAGAVTLLKRRRDQQSRRRQPGARIAEPSGNAAAVETTLRAGQEPLAVTDLDAALRTLTALTTLEDEPTTVPAVRAARITEDVLELYLVDDEATLAAPFTSAGEGAWLLQRSDRDQLLTSEEAIAYEPPCPALVTIGRDEQGGLLLLNLEQVGTLGLAGDDEISREIMTALAVDLLGAQWGDSCRVTLVGMLPELVEAVESDRANYADTLDQVLGGMEYAAQVDRAALTSSDLDDVNCARAKGLHDEAWDPHLVLVDHELSDEQRQRLDDLVQTLPRIAVAAVTRSAQVGEWVLRTRALPSGDVVADLDPIGLAVVPQRLARSTYQDMISLYRVSDEPDVPGPQWAQSITDGSTPDLGQIPVLEHPEPAAEDATPEQPTTANADAAEPAEAEDDLISDEQVEATTSAAELAQALEDEGDPTPAGSPAAPTSREDQVETQAAVPPELDADTPAADTADEQVMHPVAALQDTRQRSLRVTTRISSVPERDSNAAPAADATPLQLPDGPLLRLLGETVTLDDAPGKKPSSPDRQLEVLAYLALNPGRDSAAFTEALFPGRIYEKDIGRQRNNYMSRARTWLGQAPDEHDYVVKVTAQTGYRLADDMPVDWSIFQQLVGDHIADASTEALIQAMSLVTGAPMSRVDGTRYAWAASAMREIRSSIADVAHELSSRAARSGSPRLAMEAATKGLWAEPLMEVLWRDKITAAWAAGHPGHALAVVHECHNTLDEFGDLEQNTLDLIRQITDRTTERPVAVA